MKHMKYWGLQIGRTVPLLKPPQGSHCSAGEDDKKKFTPTPTGHPAKHFRAYQATQTPLFSKPLMSPFDTQVCHERHICLRFHQILQVILEMAFSEHCAQIWKLNWISMTIISKSAWKCISYCHQVQRCMTAPYGWGKIVQWGLKAWSR